MFNFLHIRNYLLLARELSWIVAGQLASIAGSIVLVRVLTEYLTPLAYGQLVLGLSVAGLINQLIMGGITNGFSRFYSVANEKHDQARYFAACIRIMTFATLVALFVGIFIILILSLSSYSDWLGIAAASLILSIVSGYSSSLSGILNAARKRQIVATLNAIDSWLKIIMGVAAVYLLGSNSVAIVISYVASTSIVVFAQFYTLRLAINSQNCMESGRKETNWLTEIWRYSWPFSTWGLFTWAQSVSDRWALEAFTNTSEVGQYAVLFQIGYAPIAMANGLMVTFLGPILFERSGDASSIEKNTSVHSIAWRICIATLSLTLIAVITALVFHKYIFTMFVALPYRNFSHWLPFVVLASGLFATGQMLQLKLMANIQSDRAIMMKIVTALMGATFNILGALYFGLAGVIAGLIVFSIIYLLWMILLTFKNA